MKLTLLLLPLIVVLLGVGGCPPDEDDCETTPTLPITYELEDEDGDGFYVPQDCDNFDPEINPDAVEVCDGVDNDCDGEVDEDCGDDGDSAETKRQVDVDPPPIQVTLIGIHFNLLV